MEKRVLTQAEVSMLIEGRGTFTEFNQPGMSLKKQGLIDVTPIEFHRFQWSINENGKEALSLSLSGA